MATVRWGGQHDGTYVASYRYHEMKGTYVFVSHLCGRWLVITISLFVGVSKSENLTVAMMAVDLGFRPSQQAKPPASGTGGWAVHVYP